MCLAKHPSQCFMATRDIAVDEVSSYHTYLDVGLGCSRVTGLSFAVIVQVLLRGCILASLQMSFTMLRTSEMNIMIVLRAY